MQTWEASLDQLGSATYSIDYSAEMTEMGSTLSTVVVTFSAEATALGLEKASETITGDVFSLKFSIAAAKRVFTKTGKGLDMEITYTAANGEKDSETYVLNVADL